MNFSNSISCILNTSCDEEYRCFCRPQGKQYDKCSWHAHGMPKTCCGLQVIDIPGIPISHIFMGQGGGHGKNRI